VIREVEQMAGAVALLELVYVDGPKHFQVARDLDDQEGAADQVNAVAKALEWQKYLAAACPEIKVPEGLSVGAENWRTTVLLIHQQRK